MYIAQRNQSAAQTGVTLVLIDDATEITDKSIQVMQNNALLGLFFVLVVIWLFLGVQIAVLTSIGIPFILAGTFWLLHTLDQSLNVMVLLGAVISLGMLVDDAVVIVEAIYQRLTRDMSRGRKRLTSISLAMKEVVAPVTTAVLTTMAAFLPLMLMPGILGKFMMVVPLVVSVALAISLVEAFWMLPAHILAVNTDYSRPGKIQQWRTQFTHRLQLTYVRILIKVMRRPLISLAVIGLTFVLALGAIMAGMVKVDFFASDPVRKFYVNIEMPPGTTLADTMKTTLEIEQRCRSLLREEETRALVSYAGQMFTETEPFFGNNYGQIMISLKPDNDDTLRHVDTVLDLIRNEVSDYPGAMNISFFRLAGGPPTAKPVSVKVRGDNLEQIHRAAAALKDILRSIPAIHDITDDAARGRNELNLRFDYYAIQNSGIQPAELARSLRLLVDGEIVASMQHNGEELEVRVKALPQHYPRIDALLFTPISLPGGGSRPLSSFLLDETGKGPGNIRHYNYRRAITVEADLDKTQMNTV
ncbi:MAG TPA: efflux RND transporter permease subunit, partial [Thiotrichales bacterium]|nr:efflux RND transporter permease subunit [Thiotrichales bacterium]